MNVCWSSGTISAILLALTGSAVLAQSSINCVDGKDPQTGQACIKTIRTAVPFLSIAPDARSGGLGDAGLSLSPTPASADWNPSALAFSYEQFEVQATYTPWLAALNLDDVYLANLQAYGKISDLETVYGSLRYFSLGTIPFTNENGDLLTEGRPYEMAAHVGYVRQLSEKWSGSIGGQLVISSLARGLQIPGSTEQAKNGVAGAATLGATYRDELAIASGADLTIGMSVRNLGSKISYSNASNRDFLPTNLGLGASLKTYLDDFNSLTFVLEGNKLLVPSPQEDTTDSDGDGRPDWAEQSPIQGLFNSFGDADDGFGEELREVNLSAGLEYWYAEQFAARVGYFHEPNTKGGRQYLTLGVGLRYNVLGLDFSYLIPTTAVRSPLDNTLRFSLTYSFLGDDLDGA